MRKLNLIPYLFLIVSVFLFTVNIVSASHSTSVYLFYGNSCPHCKAESEFLDTLAEKYDGLEIKRFEVYENEENYGYFLKMAKNYGIEAKSVPTIFIGDDYIVGYAGDESTGLTIENLISNCIGNGCVDPDLKTNGQENNSTQDIKIPFLENVNISSIPLPILTILIGLLDGFNPCAMFVLCFLLVFLIGTKSRKKIFIIGGVFLFISAFVYFLFISAWFNFFTVFKFVPVLKWIVTFIVVVAGLVNIKDYFFFQKGISFTLPKKWKPKIEDKIKNLIKLPNMAAMIAGVVVVALIVNVVELMCTVGFPMIYTQILATYNLPRVAYYSYILLYCLMYMIDDFLLFVAAVVTMKCFEMDKKRVRIMKLISGILMIALAVWFLLS